MSPGWRPSCAGAALADAEGAGVSDALAVEMGDGDPLVAGGFRSVLRATTASSAAAATVARVPPTARMPPGRRHHDLPLPLATPALTRAPRSRGAGTWCRPLSRSRWTRKDSSV